MKKLLLLATLLMTLQVYGKNKVLIFSKEQEDFNKLTAALVKELGSSYTTEIVKIDKTTTSENFAEVVKANNPNLIVLIDNQSVTLAQDYYKKNDKSKVPGLALMGLNFKKILKDDKHICGIAYEVSSFSLFTQFRNARKDKKLKNVLTFYRSSQFDDSIKESIEQSKMEKIDLTAVDVDKKENLLEYFKTDGLKEIKSKKYDSVYVILDSVLLEKKIFTEFWLPAAKDTGVPFLIGTEKFVNPAFGFAMFGLSPNVSDLASQAVQMAESLLEGQKCQRIEDLVGVNGYWNQKKSDDLGVDVDENAKSTLNLLK